MRHSLAVGALTIGAAGCLAFSPWNPLASHPAAARVPSTSATALADASSLEAAAKRALVAWQNLGSDPGAIDWSSGAKKVSAAVVRSGAVRATTSAEITQRRTYWEAAVSSQFGNGATARRAAAGLKNALSDLADPNVRDLGGGVDSIRYTSESLGTDTAVLKATATVWAAFAARQEGVWTYARPTNEEVVVFTFARRGATWSLTDMTSSLTHGTAP